LQLALADTGAHACIIGHRQLLGLGFTETQIQPSESYNIRSSTEMVENCIKGKVKIKMYCLLKKDNDSDCGQFGSTNVEFLVADDKINLQKVILGVPFMNQTLAKLHFHKNSCSIKCTLTTESCRKSVKLNDNKKIQLCSNTIIRVSDNECSFNMNKIITENLKMPTKLTINKQYTIYDNNTWPKIMFNNNIVLPISSLVPRGIRNLVLPIKQVVINNNNVSSDCPITQFDSQISSESEAEGTTGKPKFLGSN
jgi:hypothetical protein